MSGRKLTAPDGTALDRFGAAVAISGNDALIGAQNDRDNGFGSGSAYLFARETADPDPDPLPVPGTPLLLLAGLLMLLPGRRTGARHA